MTSIKKIVISGMGVFLIIISLLTPVVSVHAQFDPAPAIFLPIISGNTGATAASTAATAANTTAANVKETVKEVKQTIGDKILSFAKIGLLNAGRYFMRKISYDAAVYLASSGSGQKPLLATKSAENYFLDTANEAAGTAIDELGSRWGVDLCAPVGGPTLELEISLGLSRDLGVTAQAPKAPSCTLSKLSDNFDAFFEQFDDPEKALDQFGVIFLPGENDFGTTLKTQNSVLQKIGSKLAGAIKDLDWGQGFSPDTTKVGGFIKTPGSFVAQEAFGMTSDKQKQMTQGELESLSTSDSFDFVLANTATVFLNTLASQGLKRLTDKGFISLSDIFSSGGSSLYSPTASVGFGGATAAKLVYADLLTPQITSGGEFGVVNEFTVCDSGHKTSNNCVMDQKMKLAVDAANQGQPTTIKEALAKGWLNPDGRLYPEDSDKNQGFGCANPSSYCYSNLVKMRRARILPVGFETAAALSPKDNPWRLGDVVAGFGNCNTDPKDNIPDGTYDEDHPYCHLIDPHWILKAPPAKCTAKAFGQLLAQEGTSVREEYCADVQDCVATDDQGNCLGAWGYCLSEKNTWRLNADSCPAQFAGCTLYTGRKGGQNGYISTSIDHGICSASNVGCRGYLSVPYINASSTISWAKSAVDFPVNAYKTPSYKDATGIASATSTYKTFFNKNVSQCAESDNGCTKVTREDGTEISVKLAPDSFGCYDNEATTADIQLPYSIEDAKKLSAKAQCDKFAGVCGEEELGCQMYVPSNGGSSITGIATASDSCPSECVGYNAYKQEATEFENTQFPVYVIPAKATQCSFDNAGCDEFTNMDKATAGGEGKEYYKFVRTCEKPSPPAKPPSYYTWEGSEKTGFELKVYQLETAATTYTGDVTSGGPAYNTDVPTILADYSTECNKTSYSGNTASLDCREIYDSAGNVFYRYLSRTITISEDCHPLRRTGGTQTDCVAHGGTWNAASDFCIYQAITSESKQCSAAAAGCRLYQGPSSNEVMNQNFESVTSLEADTGWLGAANKVTISGESLLVGGHSMQIKAGEQTTNFKFPPTKGTTYAITFWAKGDGEIDAGLFVNGINGTKYSFVTGLNSETTKLTSTWKEYRFGPIQVSDTITINANNSSYWYLGSNGNVSMYVDNIVVTQGDFVTFIKGSSKIPVSCDANLSDNVPGPYVGCAMYKKGVDAQKEIPLKSFTNLCRPEAIGCENIIDSRNTAAAGPANFNTNLADSGGEKNTASTDDIVIGADRPLRVIINEKSVCGAASRGCQMFGVEQVQGEGSAATTVINPVFLINNPDKYAGLLCQAVAEGCDAFSTTQGSVSYFKDPSAIGKLCDYRENAKVGELKDAKGWYRSGLKEKDLPSFVSGSANAEDDVPCAPDFLQTGNNYGLWKAGDVGITNDKGYKGFVGKCSSSYNQCVEFQDPTDLNAKGKVKSYFVIDNDKIDRASCKGQVSRQEGCVLFNDTREPKKLYGASTAYEASEQKFGVSVTASDFPVVGSAQKASVYGNVQVGKDDGFDTGNPGGIPCNEKVIDAAYSGNEDKTCSVIGEQLGLAKLFFCAETASGSGIYKLNTNNLTSGNTSITGAAAFLTDKNSYVNVCNRKVAAANTILKVTRDRQCGAWLACQSYITIDNAPPGRQKQCSGLGVCVASQTGKSGGQECAKWVQPNSPTLAKSYGKILDAKNYSARGSVISSDPAIKIRYFDQDFSGLSSWNRFSPSQYEVVNVAGEPKLMAVMAENLCNGKKDGEDCVPTNPQGLGKGNCFSNKCVYPIGSSSFDDNVDLVANSCRGFPEKTSPFPSKVAQWPKPVGEQKSFEPIAFIDQQYTEASLCAQGDKCACSYKKYAYGSKPVFVDLNNKNAPNGICNGGHFSDGTTKSGFPCGFVRPAPDGKYEKCQDDRDSTKVNKIGAFEADGTTLAKPTDGLPDAEDGTCSVRGQKVQEYRGWEGFCIEPDARLPVYDSQSKNACGSWYPLDLGGGLEDINNQFKSAGYTHPEGSGTYWCVESGGNMSAVANDSTPIFGFGDKADLQAKCDTCNKYYNELSDDDKLKCTVLPTWCSKLAALTACENDNAKCPTNAHTYRSVGFTSTNELQGNGQIVLNKWPNINATELPNNVDQPIGTDQFDNRTEANTSKEIYADQLDGILIENSSNQFLLNVESRFIGADEAVRCNTLKDDSLRIQACNDYAEKVKAPIKIYSNSSVGGLSITKRFKHQDGSEDWVLLIANDQSFDSGNCGVPAFSKIYNEGDGNPFYDSDGYGNLDKEPLDKGITKDDNNPNNNDSAYFVQYSKFNADVCYHLGGASCGSGGESRYLSALRFKFDQNKKFIHSDNVLCASNFLKAAFIPKIKFVFREQCNYVASVVDEDENSFGYTQRLWSRQNNTNAQEMFYDREGVAPKKETYAYKLSSVQSYNLNYCEQADPYGSLKIDGKIDGDLAKPYVYTYSQTKVANESSCKKIKPDGTVGDPKLTENITKFHPEWFVDDGKVTQGASLACPGGNCGEYEFNKKREKTLNTGFKQGLKSLGSLFAKIPEWFSARRLPSDTGDGIVEGGYKSASKSTLVDFDTRAYDGVPPTIASFDEAKPQGSAFKIRKLNAFNINQRDQGSVYGIGNLGTAARFYAWADTDQMPLKKIFVNWGDGTNSGGSAGKYKNKKPFCSTSDTPAWYCAGNGSEKVIPNLTCQENSNSDCVLNGACTGNALVFGNDPDACVQGFHEYNHTYSYDENCGVPTPSESVADDGQYPKLLVATSQMLADKSSKVFGDLKKNGITIGDSFCVFKPKIQVQDNWGWCNGDCFEGKNGVKGCLDTGNGYGQSNQCDTTVTTTKDPYTSFGGTIVVVEGKE